MEIIQDRVRISIEKVDSYLRRNDSRENRPNAQGGKSKNPFFHIFSISFHISIYKFFASEKPVFFAAFAQVRPTKGNVFFRDVLKKVNSKSGELIMSTEAQILANRRNAQNSTGPRTSEGKAAVSQNAVKHGLLARQDVITSECQADFDLYRAQILAELAPTTPMESMLAERIVTLSWRLKRVCRIQNQAIDALNAHNTSSPLAKLTQSLFFKNQHQSQAAQAASAAHLALGRLAIKDFANARVLDRLLMYERRIEHSLYKTLLELQRLRLIKKLNPECEMPFNRSQ